MSTTAEKLQKIRNIKNNLKYIIKAKGGSITNTTPFAEYPTIVDELMGSGGGGSVDTIGKHKVVYFDVDGTILKTDYVEDGEITALPNDPSYDSEYLTFVGWSNIPKAITNDYQIGARYETITGDSYLFIRLTENIGLSPSLKITGATSIDWGDGTVDTNLTHTYADYGDYVIKISGMTSINRYLFGSSKGNYSLQKCYLGNTVTSINNDAFNSCYSLTNITIPEGVTSIGSNAFYDCTSLTSIVIPEGVTSINEGAFSLCRNLRNITIPENVTDIFGYAFSYCYSLTNITIPEGVTSISEGAFDSCYSLTNITIPESVAYISSNIFNSCYSLTNITIPEGVTSIGSNMFYNCTGLTSIVIPEGVTSIDSDAFRLCYSIIKYIFNCSTVPTLLSANIFEGINKSAYIWVRDELVEEYKTAIEWEEYASYIKPLSSMSDKLREELGL